MKAVTWRSVSGGIAAFAGIALLLIIVLSYARTGVLRGDKFRLYVAVPDASNLLKGSDVWLNGQRVGTVEHIEFAPPSTPRERRVIIAVDVLSRVREQIRIDAQVSLQSGGTVIGAPVVYLTSGTVGARAVANGDTLRGVSRSDFEIAASRATEAMEELPNIVADSRIIIANARSMGTRMTKIVHEGGRSSFASRGKAFAAKLSNGRGSASRLMRDDEMRNRIARTMADADTLRALLTTRMNEVGRFRRDSTLSRTVGSLRADVATLRSLTTSPAGTVGRITTDSALVRGLDSLFIELTALMTDIKKNPMRYSRVF